MGVWLIYNAVSFVSKAKIYFIFWYAQWLGNVIDIVGPLLTGWLHTLFDGIHASCR